KEGGKEGRGRLHGPKRGFPPGGGQGSEGPQRTEKILRKGLCEKQGTEAKAFAQFPPFPHAGRGDRRRCLGDNRPPRGKGVERTLYGSLDETRWAVVDRL